MTQARPIIMNGESVRAILDGRKTQTRRVVKYNPTCGDPDDWCHKAGSPPFESIVGDFRRFCPYGQPGDRLWVRETFVGAGNLGILYAADCPRGTESGVEGGWRPSIFMPRWASRLTLEITEVRVQRVREISGDDAFTEGVQVPVSEARGDMARPLLRLTGPVAPSAVTPKRPCEWDGGDFARFEFANLWDSLNAKRGHPWASNPWVWAITFRLEVAA